MTSTANSIVHANLEKSEFFLTTGGLETVLIFEEGYDLPEFASFVLLRTEKGRNSLKNYDLTYIKMAQRFEGCKGFLLETPTWRSSANWAAKLGIGREELRHLNQLAIKTAMDIKTEKERNKPDCPIIISGQVGPLSDGYCPDIFVGVEQAEEYHREQIRTFAEAGIEMISAATLTYVNEAVGLVKAAQSFGLPIMIGFTVETDGRLPDNTELKDAISQVDKQTGNGPIFYMINCAHPDHFSSLFKQTKQEWMRRVKAVRANPSRKSHAELDASPELDPGDPEDFGKVNAELKEILPDLRLFGGCCGTTVIHMENICQAISDLK